MIGYSGKVMIQKLAAYINQKFTEEIIALYFRQDRSNELVMVGRAGKAAIDELLAPINKDFSASSHIDHVRQPFLYQFQFNFNFNFNIYCQVTCIQYNNIHPLGKHFGLQAWW